MSHLSAARPDRPYLRAGLIGLPLDIQLGAPLLRLAHVVLALIFGLLRPVAHQARVRAPGRARHPVRDSAAEVAQLALGLLAFALGVLARAGLLQPFGPDEVADRLFGRADGLVGQPLATIFGGWRGKGGWENDGAEPEGALPTWFQDPAERLGSSLATPPEPDTAYGPTFPTLWERSFSKAALSLVCSPLVLRCGQRDAAEVAPTERGLPGRRCCR